MLRSDTRRSFLKTSAGAAGLCIVGSSAAGRALGLSRSSGSPECGLRRSRSPRCACRPVYSAMRKKSTRVPSTHSRSTGSFTHSESPPAFHRMLFLIKARKSQPVNCAVSFCRRGIIFPLWRWQYAGSANDVLEEPRR